MNQSKQQIAKLLPGPGLRARALLYALCAFAMVLAFSVAPDSRPTLHKKVQSQRQAQLVIRGRSRKVFVGLRSGSGSGPKFTPRLPRSRQNYAIHFVAEAMSPLALPAGRSGQFWALSGGASALPSALHPVFAPPIRL